MLKKFEKKPVSNNQIRPLIEYLKDQNLLLDEVGKILYKEHNALKGRDTELITALASKKAEIMGKKIRTEEVDHLFDAILCLKNREECYQFFEDVCTVNEILSLSQRFEVAKMLKEKKTYLEISEKTGASTATISRVNRSLNYGNDGYDMVFERISKDS